MSTIQLPTTRKKSADDYQIVTGEASADGTKFVQHVKNPDPQDVFIPDQQHTAFSELITSEKNVIIELKSAVDEISNLRNITTTAGAGSVTLVNSEYKLSTTALASDDAELKSAEKGRYIPGYQAEMGIGIRVPDTTVYAGEMDAQWGYFDAQDGYLFGHDATGFYVAIKRAGTTTKTYQTNFNSDKVDGTGESGYTLDLEAGNIYEIDFLWYGYGPIRFYILAKSTSAFERDAKKILVHTIIPDGETSTEQPNLPITARVENGATATAHDLFVGGRQFSIYGRYDPIFRLTGEFAAGQSLTTTFRPLISARIKNTSKFLNQICRFDSINIFADTDIILGFVLNGTLGGASFGTPTNATAAETVIETDTSATTISGGHYTGGYYTFPGANNRAVQFQNNRQIQDLVANQPFTVVARALAGTGNVTGVTLNVREEW